MCFAQYAYQSKQVIHQTNAVIHGESIRTLDHTFQKGLLVKHSIKASCTHVNLEVFRIMANVP